MVETLLAKSPGYEVRAACDQCATNNNRCDLHRDNGYRCHCSHAEQNPQEGAALGG